MEDRTGTGRIADYFVVAGLPEKPEPVDEDYCEGLNPNEHNMEPITDITVIFPSLGEVVPRGFVCVEHTPTGYPANLNSGSIRSPEVYICYRRGKDKPPLVDIGVMYDGKERLLADAEVVISTPGGRPANVNNTSARTFLTYRRASENMPCNELVVTDVCVIIQNKGERAPHAFCIILKNLNKGMMGCDVYLCYKKSMNRPPLLSYKADVLLRYPPMDRPGFPFPSSVAMFCLPMCATVECWPKIAQQPRPVFSTFVLTVADATEKIYGAAITFYEKFPEDKLNVEQKAALGVDLPGDKTSKSVHVNKCICLLSHYPFFDSFRSFLYYLNNMCRLGPHDVPIERYISHLLEEVPFPSPSRPHILMQLSPTQSVLMSHPHDSPLPKSGASFRFMLSNLGPENCLLVLLLILTEQKTLIHSLRPDVLTAVVEAIAVIIFPFRWQCPYIPLCPLGLCAVLQAPVPFLIGVDSRFFDLYELPSDVTCVDLDTNTITVSEDKRSLLNIKLLAKKPARILKHALETIQEKIYCMGRTQAKNRGDAQDNMELDFQVKKRERMLELEIQEAFLRFMTSVLKGYRSFLLPITKAPTIGATDASSLFDFQGFLRSRDKNYQKFYQLMLRTQMFIKFIEERSFVSDHIIDTGLAFFDECIDKVCQDDSETLRLIDYSEGNVSDRTVFVMPPEASGLPPNQNYSYNAVFKLNESLFGNVKLKSGSVDRLLQRNDMSAPGSPIARRTKQEIKYSQKNARKYSEVPMQWAKYLMSTCYSLWFIHLPSYLQVAASKHMALCMAYEMLVRMAKNRIQPADEVCYRVVMQLCGLYSQPVVAVKVLFEMKRCGITPNAITYGFYNKAVLEAQWPSNVSNSSQLMWNKLRNVIVGVAQFRAAGRHYNLKSRRLSQSTDDVDRISTGSGASADSQNQNQAKLLSQKINQTSNNGTSGSVATAVSTASTIISGTLQNASSASTGKNGNGPYVNSMPTRISSSSDIGYGSMNEQKVTDTEIEPEADAEVDEEIETGATNNDNGSNEEQTRTNASESFLKSGRFWGKMGQSLDHWVKSGVSSLANVATLASDTSYYSPGGLIMSGYRGDYSSSARDEDDDDLEVEADAYDEHQAKVGTSRRLNFSGDGDDDSDNENENSKKSETLRLLRSVSFGNDTQIMSKLKELKQELVKGGNSNGISSKFLFNSSNSPNHGSPSNVPTPHPHSSPVKSSSNSVSKSPSHSQKQKRSGSEESNGSLETKINQFYEGSNSREASIEKSASVNSGSNSYSREVTPVEEEVDVGGGMGTVTENGTVVAGLSGGVHSLDLSANLLPQPPIPKSPSIQIRSRETNLQSKDISPCSPARTPVTQNDPLGALSDPASPQHPRGITTPPPQTSASSHNDSQKMHSESLPNRDSPKRACSEGFIGHIMTMTPPRALGGSHNGGKDYSGTGSASKSFHRSSTLPNYSLSLLGSDGNGDGHGSLSSSAVSPHDPNQMNLVACAGMSGGSATNVVSSLSAISSSLKNPFGRYSPARLSLRKAGNSLIESTIGGKKAEALMEGFNQFKSVAAVTAKKKLDEFKEAIGNNGVPGRSGPFGEDYYREPMEGSEWENGDQAGNQWASVSDSYLDQLFPTDGSTRASFASGDMGPGPSHVDTPLSSSTQSLLLLDNAKNLNSLKKDHQQVALHISMSTCSVCHNCNSLIFDEEIMAGWTAEDSNLNTTCPHCKKWEVPFLEVTVKDYRHYPMALLNPPQLPLTSAPSLESVNSLPNPSRRTSAVNPQSHSASNINVSNANVTNLTSNSADNSDKRSSGSDKDIKDKDTPDFKKSSRDRDSTFLLNNSGLDSVSKCVNGESPCLDPLGVIEERSRRNSPEPEEMQLPHPAATASGILVSVPSLLTVPNANSDNPSTVSAVPGQGQEEKLSQKSLPLPTLASSHPHIPVPVPSQILDGVQAEPIIVPYLSPLVLRKELENVLEHEGDSCLIQGRFVDEHPIIYWNLVWFFHRSNLTSHIKGLTLLAKSIKPTRKVAKYSMETNELVDGEWETFSVDPSWASSDHRNVAISCKWDNPKFHEQFGVPLYVHYLQNMKDSGATVKTDEDNVKAAVKSDNNSKSKLIGDVLRSVQQNQLSKTCPQLLFHYHKEGRNRHYPAYRDILFLSLTAGSREAVESYGYGFERDYRDAYSRLRNSDEYESMEIGDTPPSDAAIFCRRYFRDLQIP